MAQGGDDGFTIALGLSGNVAYAFRGSGSGQLMYIYNGKGFFNLNNHYFGTLGSGSPLTGVSTSVGGDLSAFMLGHAKLETTEIYTHVSIRQLKAIHESTHPARMYSLVARELRAEIEKMQQEETTGLMNDSL